MTDLEIMAIERACERLVLDFAGFSDRQAYESLASLFIEHGTLTRPSGDVLIGHEAIVRSYQSRPRQHVTRHICTNIRITVESNDRARGFTYAIVYSADSNPRIGEFEDDFLRTPEGWRIAARNARFVKFSS
jgi:hypothetical protein